MEVLCASRIRKSQLSWECGRWCPVAGVYRHQKKECPGISSIHHTQGKQRMVHQRKNSHVSLPGSSHRLHEHLLATHVVTRPTAHLFAFCLSTKPVRSKMFRWLGDPEFKGSSYLRCLTACHTRASSATSAACYSSPSGRQLHRAIKGSSLCLFPTYTHTQAHHIGNVTCESRFHSRVISDRR